MDDLEIREAQVVFVNLQSTRAMRLVRRHP